MIEFVNVSKTYTSGFSALTAANFVIHPGEMVLLTGPSGSGKTTIFRLILRLILPTQGQVIVNKKDVEKLKKSEISQLRRQIGTVFQNPQLIQSQSVFDNVALPLLVSGYRAEHVELRVNAALNKVGLTRKSHLFITELSSGEQKRTEIARAIVTTPKILLVDEPTENVDATTAIEMLNLFKAFNQIGMTIVIATHHRNLLNGIHTRSFHVKNGCVETGEKHESETIV